MEGIVKKLLVTTGLIASSAVALLPLTSYAEPVTNPVDPHGVYNCSDEPGGVPCARADQQEGGPTLVTVDVKPVLAIDAVSLTCAGESDTCVNVGGDESGKNIKAIQAYPGMVRTGALTARVRSAKPFTISISAEDPYLKNYDEAGNIAGVIPSNNLIDGEHNGWGIQKDGAYAGVTTRPTVFYTSDVAQDDFANFNFEVGVSANNTIPQGIYETEVTVTAATIATN